MANHELTHRLAAILAADACGFARLMAADDRATVAALDAAREVFRIHIESRRGRVIDMAGDSELAVFETAGGAVSAAIAAQEQLEEAMTEIAQERQLRFRVGMHLGDVISKQDGSVYGDGVNIAARLQALADAGGIVVSESVRVAVRGKLGAGFEDLGEQQVRNISEPVRVWRVHPGGEAAFAHSTKPGRLSLAQTSADARPAGLPERPSIVVLPFTNLSEDPGQDYFADGMVEEIITELSRFHRLLVIARNTSFTYKGKVLDAKRVAQELGVQFLLCGSVRRAGQRVRVTAQLVEGHSGHQLWAERYEDLLSDVFELQERITRQVVGTMVPEIEAEEMRLSGYGKRRYAAADDMAWRAAKAMSDSIFGAGPERSLQAIEIAAQAIALDTGCALAWYVLGNTHCWRVFMAWAPDRTQELAVARHAADMLLSVEPNDSRSYFQRGLAYELSGDASAGAADLRRALKINPNDATVLFYLSFVEAAEGNTLRARELADEALRMSPKDRWLGTAYMARAVCAFVERDWQALHDWADLAIQAQASHPMRRVLMIAFAAETGDQPLLQKHLGRLRAVAPDFIPNLFRGEYRALHRPQHMAELLDSLRKGGLTG
ncbi:MAG: tetratricopeptide repeat protein [Rhodoferax sp.]|nr:tetratricopeptide repeat protein [Rhodoferax sp.]